MPRLPLHLAPPTASGVPGLRRLAIIALSLAGLVLSCASLPASARALGVKPVIAGLIDRQGPPAAAALPYVHAYVVKVDWAQLQPTAFGPIAANNPIDQAIARVRQPDFAAVGMALKLRVFAGIGAPEWVKELGGAPVPYVDNQDGASVSGGTIPRFWTSSYGLAYRDLQSKLAARYDTVPEVREVTLSGCSTIFDEPFVRQFGDPGNVANLLAAGYTTAADQACVSRAIAAQRAWRYTTTDVDFSPFPDIAHPADARDLGFTTSMMALCRADLGSRCGLQNNALSTSKLANPVYRQMYATMQSLGKPLVFQTAAMPRLGDPAQVLTAARAMGANSVELPAGYSAWPTTTLALFAG